MPVAQNDIEIRAECGQLGVILMGELSVTIFTEYSIGKRKCAGCQFVCIDGNRATLGQSNTDKHRLCLENDAPLSR